MANSCRKTGQALGKTETWRSRKSYTVGHDEEEEEEEEEDKDKSGIVPRRDGHTGAVPRLHRNRTVRMRATPYWWSSSMPNSEENVERSDSTT